MDKNFIRLHVPKFSSREEIFNNDRIVREFKKSIYNTQNWKESFSLRELVIMFIFSNSGLNCTVSYFELLESLDNIVDGLKCQK